MFNRSPNTVSKKVSELGLNMPRKKRKTQKEKKCSCCGDIKPRTEEYFFKKTVYNKKDKSKTYQSFRSICKICWSKEQTRKNRLKRIKELGCTLSNYEKTWRSINGKTIRKYPFLYDYNLTKNQIAYIITKIKKGYKFVNHEKFLEDCKKDRRESLEKRGRGIYKDIPDEYVLWKDVPKDIRNNIINKRDPSDAQACNWLGKKIGDLDKETIETKKLIVKINRFIKENG